MFCKMYIILQIHLVKKKKIPPISSLIIDINLFCISDAVDKDFYCLFRQLHIFKQFNSSSK